MNATQRYGLRRHWSDIQFWMKPWRVAYDCSIGDGSIEDGFGRLIEDLHKSEDAGETLRVLQSSDRGWSAVARVMQRCDPSLWHCILTDVQKYEDNREALELIGRDYEDL